MRLPWAAHFGAGDGVDGGNGFRQRAVKGGKDPGRAQPVMNIGENTRSVHPMQGVGDSDDIDGCGRLGEVFGGNVADDGGRKIFFEFCGHAGVGLDGDDFTEMREKRASGFAGAGAKVDSTFAAISGNSGKDAREKLRRIIGTVALEFFGGMTETRMESPRT